MTTVLEVLANIGVALLGAAFGIYTARWTKAFDRWLGTKWKWGGEKHVGTYLIDFLLLAFVGIFALVSNGIIQTAAIFAFVGLAASVVFKVVAFLVATFVTGYIGKLSIHAADRTVDWWDKRRRGRETPPTP